MRILILTLMMSFWSLRSPGTEEIKVSEVAGECCICMCTMSKEDCHILACRHKFHTKCIQEWFTHNTTCPFCRAGKVNSQAESLVSFLFENNIGGTAGALVAIGFIGGLVAFLIFISEIGSSLA
jgi:hypothetical protein